MTMHMRLVKAPGETSIAPVPQIDDFSAMVQLIYQGALDSHAWRTFLKMLTEKLGGNTAVLILRIPRLGEIPMKVVYGDIPERDASYFGYYMAMDPFVNLPEGKAITMHDFVGHDELEQSAYYREWLVPLDTVYAIGVDLRDRHRYHVRLRICRSHRSKNFSPADCRYVERFVPHLKTAIRIFSELDVVRSECEFYAEAMDQLMLATIVLDENGKILHANRLAETILAEGDGITRSGDTLVLAHHDNAKQFREMVARAAAVQRSCRPGIAEVMRVRRPSGRPDISLVVRPSSSVMGRQNERLTTSIAVFLSADAVQAETHSVPSSVLQKLFDLTPKEAELALKLASGLSLQEASESLGISPNTARAHLRSIFAKTGVDRQAALVRVLLRSVAMLGQ